LDVYHSSEYDARTPSAIEEGNDDGQACRSTADDVCVGDLLFINDVLPNDWTALFSGRPLEYLKLGSDAVKVDLCGEPASFELVLSPFFRPRQLPGENRFVVENPFADVPIPTSGPASALGNTEAALRGYGTVAEFGASLYPYRGFHRAPAMRPDDSSSQRWSMRPSRA
jgi:hypothetical protein